MVASAPGRITPHRTPPYEQLDLRHEFVHLFSGKSTKTAATRAALFDSSSLCTKFAPDPHSPHWGLGKLTALTQTPSWVLGALFLRGRKE